MHDVIKMLLLLTPAINSIEQYKTQESMQVYTSAISHFFGGEFIYQCKFIPEFY